ncbi:hypothetical protein BC941DRAFT_413170 [Chlamydoabsidia padenii]|nr:hypothetical protein BC941DRAFT_413170 [Chlamydoabsidia padenii]
MTPNVADIIARINWDSPTLTHTDPTKVPIQRLKPATDGQLPLSASGSPSSDHTGVGGKQKKTAHNAIERRYRNNINDRIAELKNAVPALLHAKPKEKDRTGGQVGKRHRLDDDDDDIGDDGEEYLDGVAVATKLNKATILRKATEYINHLKRTGDDMKRENDSLQHLLAQLPGGHEVLAHYQIQKLQREQMMQRQLMMERQMIKQEQQDRKKAASKRKRAKRQYNNNSNIHHEDYDDGSLSSNSGDHPPTPPSNNDGLANNRVFMALFMAISFFSSSPLTTPGGSEQVNNHHHVSRTTSEQMNAASAPTANDSYNSYNTINNQSGGSWISIEDGWSILRLVLFIACLIQLLLPYLKSWVFGHSFRVRRIVTTPKSRQHQHARRMGKNKKLDFGNKTTPFMSPGDEKCMQMYQLLVKLLLVDHDDTTVRLSSIHKIGLLSSLVKELVIFGTRHVFGYDIACGNHRQEDDDTLDDDEWEQKTLHRWGHVFKWIKLNECECLGGNPFLSRLTMLYHSVRMLNLVDSLEEDLDNDLRVYDVDDDDDTDGGREEQQRKQLSSMRARAYATATIQMVLGIPYAFLANRVADYLWGVAIWDANEEDAWACLTEDDHDDNLMTSLSTKEAWIETLDVIRNQITNWTLVSTTTATTTALAQKSRGLSLSANAPALVPTAILSNLFLLDRLESDFCSLIDGMIINSPLSTSSSRHDLSTTMFFAYASSLSLKDDSRRVADWFTLVGVAVEALWRHDVERAEQSMMTLIQRVPRALVVPGFSKKKARHGELDAIAKQQVVHMLAGATLLLKQDSQGIKELEIAENLRHRKTKKALPSTNELEATHVEGRVMALVEFAVMLVGLEAWVSTWRQQSAWDCDNIIHVDNNNKKNLNSSHGAVITTAEETNEQVRLVSLSLRRMVRRPALAGLKTQQIIIDRLSRVGRFVEEYHQDQDDDMEDADSAYEHSGSDDDTRNNNNDQRRSDQDKLVRRADKVMSILQGN